MAAPEGDAQHHQREREVHQVVGVGRHQRLRPVDGRLNRPFDVETHCGFDLEQTRRVAHGNELRLTGEIPDDRVDRPESGEQHEICQPIGSAAVGVGCDMCLGVDPVQSAEVPPPRRPPQA